MAYHMGKLGFRAISFVIQREGRAFSSSRGRSLLGLVDLGMVWGRLAVMVV